MTSGHETPVYGEAYLQVWKPLLTQVRTVYHVVSRFENKESENMVMQTFDSDIV